MSSEMNMPEMDIKVAAPAMSGTVVFILDQEAAQGMRHCLHELANIFTGLMIAGGLLAQHPEMESLERYVTDLCEGSERGSALVRELRSKMLAACGEAETARPRSAAPAAQGQ